MGLSSFDKVEAPGGFTSGGVSILNGGLQAAVVTPLTENSGAIGGSNDSNLPDLTATYVARTSTVGGTANGAYEDEGVVTSAGGNTYADATVNTVIAKLKNNIAELSVVVAQLAADNVNLRAAIRENAAKQNAVLTSFKASTQMASA